MTSNRRIIITEESQVGEARRCVSDLCHRLGMDETFAGKAAIVATEMTRNIVRHGGGGEFLIREVSGQYVSSIELIALDKGPGMHNVAECMRDGFSTIGTAGTGLGSIKRSADRAEFYSQPGRGTAVWARLCSSAAPASEVDFEFGAVSVAMQGEEVCGDGWSVLHGPGALRVLVADGLGHGPFAEEAAREAISVFRSYPGAPIPEVMTLAHQALQKTRGAAGAIVEMRASDRQVCNLGIGNISMRLVSAGKSKNLVSDNGTLGASMQRARSFSQDWTEEMLLVMHSDGIGAQWNLEDYPGLANRHPGLIASVLYRDFKRTRDDATVVAARYNPRR